MSINSLNVQESVCPRARDDGRGVEHDVHDTRLTGAMVARTCGAHQGAGATSTCFEASGGLQSANEERGETRDEDEGRVEWGEDEGRVGGDIITCDSRARREGSPHSRARAVGHEIGFRAQRSTLGPPLQDRPLPLSRLLKLSCHSNEVVYLHRDQLQQ